MPNLVVYSVQTGAKGDFAGFGVGPGPGYDLVLLTDDESLSGDGFRTQLIDNRGIDPSRSSRHPKLQPHRYFPDHEWSLYVDGNAYLKADPLEILSHYPDRPENLFAFRHPDRDCIFDEAEFLIGQDYDREEVIREQMDHYRREGMPRRHGLVAGTFLLRRHNRPDVMRFGEEWYEHVLRFSKRDQLSFGFVCWRQGFRYGHLAGEITGNDHLAWPRRPRSQRVTSDFHEGFYVRRNPEVASSGLSPREHFLARRRNGEAAGPYKPHSWTLRKLANRHGSEIGNIYGDAHNYADVYESLLRGRREEPLRVLQIGSGPVSPLSAPGAQLLARLRIWSEYLPNARIVSLSPEPPDGEALPERAEALEGTPASVQGTPALLEAAGGGFDLIVDSAACSRRERQAALAVLFGRLNAGGLLAIENLHQEPPDPEDDAVPQTSRVLAFLARGKVLQSPALDVAEQARIMSGLRDVLTFDSWDRESGRIPRDALAILRRRGD